MPGGKHENMQAWSPEEDTIILDMHTQLGPMWSKIVKQLPGRTVSSVRTRWQRIEKGRKHSRQRVCVYLSHTQDSDRHTQQSTPRLSPL